MDSVDHVNASVLQYLETIGFKKSAELLRKEASAVQAKTIASNLDTETVGSLANIVKFFNADESYPKRYEDSYVSFKEWAEQSLDVFKPDLLTALYPLYIHSFLDMIERGYSNEAHRFLKAHRDDHPQNFHGDIEKLEGIFTAEQMKENNFTRSLRENKMQLTMSNYAFELLLSFLHEKKYMLLIAILNTRVHAKVSTGVPKRKEVANIVAPSQRTLVSENDENLMDEEKSADVRWSLNVKQSGYAGVKVDPKAAPTALTPLPILSTAEEKRIFDEVRQRIALSADKQPSIAFFTVFNSHQTANRVAVNRDSSLVASGMSNSVIKLFDLNEDNSEWTRITERYVETDGRAEIYKPSKKNAREVELIGHSGPVFGLSFSPDDQFLLSSSSDNTVRLWSMATKSCAVVYRGHSHPVWDVQFSPLGYYFATASNDRTARLWVTSQVNPVRLFVGHLSDVNCVRFHPNCNYVFTGSSDKTVRMWDVNSGETVRLFIGHSAPVFALAVSPDGRFLASAGEDKEIYLWDLKTSRRIAILKGHTAPIWSLDFSAEGALLASGSLDKTIRLWDILSILNELEANPELVDSEKNILVSTFATKKTPVFSVQFTRMNLLFGAGRFDKTEGDDDEGDEEAMIDEAVPPS